MRGEVQPGVLQGDCVGGVAADFHDGRQSARERGFQQFVDAPGVGGARFLPYPVEPLAAHAGQLGVSQEIVS